MNDHELLLEQPSAYIGGKVSHDLKIVSPVQIRMETKEVLCLCATCQEKTWIQLPEDGFQRLLKDIAMGKIK